jgi:uncharacterized membrane protein YgdD (TMEM256/DUF423 family)
LKTLEKQTKSTLIIALLLLISGIVLGAFGAHGLKDFVSSEKINSFEVGVRYQILNALGLMTLAALKPQFNFSIKNAVVFILLGVICFSCSIYGLTFLLKGDSLGKVLGPITPIGGLLLIIGWSLILIKVFKIEVKN